MNTLFLCFVLSLAKEISGTFYYGTPSQHLTAEGNRISGMQDRRGKDIVIGGLVRVHSHDGGGQCGKVLLHKSVENLEALLFAIDTINSDPNLLPNITLGYDIRDTCVSESVALDSSVDMVFSSGQIELESCNDGQFRNRSEETPVSAVIGAIVSSVTIPVASLFRLFEMPQVSFSSTSPILSDRDRYSYFFRTIPPDDQQAQAMIDLILYFQWDHVSTLYSNNLYGQPGIIQFHRLAQSNGICIDLNEGLEDTFNETKYREIATRLYNSHANVVVLFASLNHVEGLLTAVRNIYQVSTKKRQFLWIASDGWSELVKTEYNNITAGKWGTAPSSQIVPSFDDYYSKLTPASNVRNPWFTEFYNAYFNGSNTNSSKPITDDERYSQDSFDPLVIDAVYSVAYALDSFLRENCEQPFVWYPNNRTCHGYNGKLTGTLLRSYLKKVNFTSPSQSKVRFDEFGNVEGKYQILNYQVKPCVTNDCFKLEEVGLWDGSASQNRLQFFPNITKQFGVNQSSGDVLLSLSSQCQQCSPGFRKRQVTSSCCGTCDPCLGSNYTNSTTSTECQVCPDNMWGNDPLTGSTDCVDIEESYLQATDPWAIVLIILAIIGLLAVAFVVGVFIWFWNTPIVKSSGREQMILLLIGITLCFLITVFFILKPSPAVCGLQRIGLWFSYSLILCALFVKLVRIARIFLQKKFSTRPKFIAPIYQILFTFILVSFQMILVLISLGVVFPDVNQTLRRNESNHHDFPVFVLQCTSPHVALVVLQMIYYSALIIASNALAILTIRFPANFNESKYVAFSTFSLGLLWFIFILSFVATDNTANQAAVLSFTVQVSALSVLVCLFGPRIFIMIFQPSQNVKATEKTVSTNLQQRGSKDNSTVLSIVASVEINKEERKAVATEKDESL